MASLLGGLVNRAPAAVAGQPPIPYTSRSARWSLPWGMSREREQQLAAPGANGTLFGIQERIGGAVAKATWHLYRKAKSGKDEDRVEVTSHPALDLWRKPNKFFNENRFKRAVQQHKDLVGEGWIVVRRMGGLPIDMWHVRPDRMTPVPDPDTFLAGYIYTAPDGEQVPLDVDEVIPLLQPHPLDPYRGMGAVQAILADLDSARYSAEWNRSFFLNSAEPGGIIQVDKRLSDPEFDELRTRWNEQHKGVSKAHRVAILEQGQWVDRKMSQKDMQFVELRTATRDQILEAFGFPKSMLGVVEDANKANSEEANTMFAEWVTVPRLDDWRDALNWHLLPMYGDVGEGYEFDYDSPVPEDLAAEDARLTARSTAAKTFIDAGFTGESVQDALELPDGLVWEKPEPQPAPGTAPVPAAPGAPQPPAPPAAPEPPAARVSASRFRAAPPLGTPPEGWPEIDRDTVDAIDLAPVQSAWERALAGLLEAWQSSVVAGWVDQLLEQIRTVLRGDGGALATLTVDTTDAASRLAHAMAGLGETAAGHAVAEAAAQDVTLSPVWPSAADLAAAARETAAFEGQRYALTAGREAARVRAPGVPDDDVVEHVRAQLTELSDAGARQALGAALTDAQNQARQQTMRHGPVGALYASEQMDSNTCGPCREVHGRWIATTDDLTAVFKLYPTGGYIDCKGRWRCRGTIVGVWRPKTTDGGA
ncbi:phage portal protein [Amycolatopsis sp. NPDC001319]|uniref:phage portal protein n=1 Tax=unclassified Amycolatopsis TaxID=2618356 RepID=UPI0036B77115